MAEVPKNFGRLVTALSQGMDYRELWFEAENGNISFVSVRWDERKKTWEVLSTTEIARSTQE